MALTRPVYLFLFKSLAITTIGVIRTNPMEYKNVIFLAALCCWLRMGIRFTMYALALRSAHGGPWPFSKAFSKLMPDG